MKVKDVVGKNKKANTHNAYNISILKYNKKNGFISGIITRKTTDPKNLGRSYHVVLDWNDSKLTMNSDIKVSCSCTDFSARWRWVLNKHKGYYIGKNMFTLNDLSLTQPPNVTNPDYNLGVCKHLEFALSAMLKVSK